MAFLALQSSAAVEAAASALSLRARSPCTQIKHFCQASYVCQAGTARLLEQDEHTMYDKGVCKCLCTLPNVHFVPLSYLLRATSFA